MKKKKLAKPKVVHQENDDHMIIPEPNDRSMSNHISDGNFNFTEEREFKSNPVAAKSFFDLFKDEEALVPAPLIRAKHFKTADKTDRWRIYKDSKVIFTLEGAKLLKKERDFLRTVDGVRLLLEQGKTQLISVSSLKKAIRERRK